MGEDGCAGATWQYCKYIYSLLFANPLRAYDLICHHDSPLLREIQVMKYSQIHITRMPLVLNSCPMTSGPELFAWCLPGPPGQT